VNRDTEVTLTLRMVREYVWTGAISDLPRGVLDAEGEFDMDALSESDLATLSADADIQTEDWDLDSVDEV
jgi:hypothetical protein